MQERSALIQADIHVERGELLKDISAQTKLLAATEKAYAGENTRQKTAKENEWPNNDLGKQIKTCSSKCTNYETETCTLKKLHGELRKLKDNAHSARF